MKNEMNGSYSDPLVLFGASGDVAYKILPSLQTMMNLGTPNVSVVAVAKADWKIEQLRERERGISRPFLNRESKVRWMTSHGKVASSLNAGWNCH